ncbi:proto-oncogene tyrosine- kinase [Brachionus plicatilis]|uniref:Proto-oncogene tyrosine-kinase n=1 Tax=Brachionus plicatilis TaxID=10195 RepID=A0A3M7SZ32_BRAPC|nr:proto-oncogene tyrosine- kinase [Brachionus plicatilis]
MESTRCRSLLDFSYDFMLDQVYYNEQNADLLERVIAVKNKTRLVHLVFEKSTVVKENLIKEFAETIVLVETKWSFGRVYIMTLCIKENLNRVYEVDLNFKTIIEVVSFTSVKNAIFFLTSDPFHATLSYVINNNIYAVNTHYPNITDDLLKRYRNQASYIDLGKSENFYMDSAYCANSKYGSFDFVLTSSVISGYESIQTYFIRSNSKYFQCLIYKQQCTCAPFKDLSIKNKFIQVSDYYQSQHCTEKIDKNSIIFENKVSNFGEHGKQFRKCLQICSLPKWKKDINYEYTSTSINCVNNLKLTSSLDQFGITLVQKNNKQSYKMRINYYKEFMEQLVDECSRYELMYKYSVFYGSLKYLEQVTGVKDYQNIRSSESIESRIEIDLEPGLFYILNVFIQTPFDNKALNLGTFVLSNRFELRIGKNFTLPNYQKVLVDPNPVLYAKNWFEHVSSNKVIICILSQSINLKSQLKYILTEVDSGKTKVKHVSSNNDVYYSVSKIEPKLNQILFKIENLNENSVYHLRIMSEPMPNQVSSLSNLIKFNTLKRPHFEILLISSDKVYISIFLYCKLVLEEENVNYYTKKVENACHLFRLLVKPENSDTWEEKNEVLISDEQVKIIDDDALNIKILIKNLSAFTNYSIRIDSETYFFNSNSIRFESNMQILSSNITNFKTKKSPRSYYSFILIGIGSFVSLIALVLFYLTNFLKKTKKIFFMNLKSKNGFDYEKNTFLENMSPNLLYSFAIKKKEIKKELIKLPNVDERDLELIRLIGKGAFGQVFEGLLKINELKTSVAIKKLRESVYSDEKLDLVKEALALNSFNHPNLLKFYGICSSKNKSNEIEVKFIITELMNNGDLLSYLRLCRKTKKNLEYKKAIKIFFDISNACTYLESKGFIHRDLAARNCLVHIEQKWESENLIVKLGDFGMAHELYSAPVKDYYKQVDNINKLLPIRWMSPESICEGVYSSKSDVWAFGVIVWEVLTLGFQPYFGMQNIQVIEYVKSGGKLQIPQKCPSEMTDLMINCWQSCSGKRPTFGKISNDLNKIYSKSDYLNQSKNVIPIFDETYLNDNPNLKICPIASFIKRSNCSEFDEGFSDVFSETPESSLNRENKSLIN